MSRTHTVIQGIMQPIQRFETDPHTGTFHPCNQTATTKKEQAWQDTVMDRLRNLLSSLHDGPSSREGCGVLLHNFLMAKGSLPSKAKRRMEHQGLMSESQITEEMARFICIRNALMDKTFMFSCLDFAAHVRLTSLFAQYLRQVRFGTRNLLADLSDKFRTHMPPSSVWHDIVENERDGFMHMREGIARAIAHIVALTSRDVEGVAVIDAGVDPVVPAARSEGGSWDDLIDLSGDGDSGVTGINSVVPAAGDGDAGVAVIDPVVPVSGNDNEVPRPTKRARTTEPGAINNEQQQRYISEAEKQDSCGGGPFRQYFDEHDGKGYARCVAMTILAGTHDEFHAKPLTYLLTNMATTNLQLEMAHRYLEQCIAAPAPTPSPPVEEDPRLPECPMCLSEPMDILFSECGHLCICRSCLERLPKRPRGKHKCVMCRVESKAIRVYV